MGRFSQAMEQNEVQYGSVVKTGFSEVDSKYRILLGSIPVEGNRKKQD